MSIYHDFFSLYFLSSNFFCYTNNSAHANAYTSGSAHLFKFHILHTRLMSAIKEMQYVHSFCSILECKTSNKKNQTMFLTKFIYLLLFFSSLCTASRWYRMFYSNRDDPCIDRHNHYQRCIPNFINAAFRKSIHASSTCGNPPREFCSNKNVCHLCDASEIKTSYPTDYLTDINNPNNITCWQSDIIKSRENISLILSLHKKFEITYISLQFCSDIIPDSMAIFKSMDIVR